MRVPTDEEYRAMSPEEQQAAFQAWIADQKRRKRRDDILQGICCLLWTGIIICEFVR